MIYCLEPLSYYYGMKPMEFWNCRYKEVYLYCEMNMLRIKEDFKQSILLQEATTDKLIQADSMSKKPKIVPLRKIFKELFKKN